eukprot:scaffold154780_cov27-Tisochrysis_lutea.AAC.3
MEASSLHPRRSIRDACMATKCASASNTASPPAPPKLRVRPPTIGGGASRKDSGDGGERADGGVGGEEGEGGGVILHCRRRQSAPKAIARELGSDGRSRTSHTGGTISAWRLSEKPSKEPNTRRRAAAASARSDAGLPLLVRLPPDVELGCVACSLRLLLRDGQGPRCGGSTG